MPEPSDTEFPYHRVAAELRAAILGGQLRPGDRLSSEWKLAEQYTTSRPTVRRAIALLKAEGLIVTEQDQRRASFWSRSWRATPPPRSRNGCRSTWGRPSSHGGDCSS